MSEYTELEENQAENNNDQNNNTNATGNQREKKQTVRFSEPPRVGRRRSSLLLSAAALGSLSDSALNERLRVEEEEQSPVTSKRPEPASFSDRVTFTLGTINICLVCFFLGMSTSHPEFLCALYVVKMVVLIPYRYFAFRRQGAHLFLLDFCYLVNVVLISLVIADIGFNESTVYAFLALWALCHGPLAFAVMTFNNQTRFHSIQHIISLMIHLTPGLVLFALRWGKETKSKEVADDFCANAQIWQIALLPLLFAIPVHFVWASVYHLVVFVWKGNYIKEKGYQTLFEEVAGEQSRSPAKPLLVKFQAYPSLQRIMYMVVHLVFTLATGSFSPLFLCSKEAHFLFLAFVGSMSIWNSSNYYMRGNKNTSS